MDGATNLPTGDTIAVDFDTSQCPNNCYAFEYKDTVSCSLYCTAIITAVATADNTTADMKCKKRRKTGYGAAVVAAVAASATSETEYTDMIDDIDDWADQAEVVEGHVRLLRIATEYKDALLVLKEGAADDAESTGWDGAT